MHSSVAKLAPSTQQAIATLYDRFAVPVPTVIEGCPCCIAKRGVDLLIVTPLRELSGQALWSYISGAFLTVGAERDFIYLLPRIMEIGIAALDDAQDPPIILDKLRRADWRLWPADRQVAVERAVDAWIDEAIVRDRAAVSEGWIGDETEDVLCGAARAGMPLERWRERLLRADAAEVLHHLRQRCTGDTSPFWDLAPGGLEQLSALLAKAMVA